MSWLRVLALLLLVLLYLRSPIDLIPDRLGLPGLLDDLLVLLASVWWLRRQRRATPRGQRRGTQAQPGTAADWDPYRVLGVSRGASADEITRAYREQMKRYHPDRVADLGEELQRVAHNKAVEIQRAYAEIGKS